MTTNKRTPDQLAKHYQAKANQARAKASKIARTADAHRKIVLGGALIARAEEVASMPGGTQTADEWLYETLGQHVEERHKAVAFVSAWPPILVAPAEPELNLVLRAENVGSPPQVTLPEPPSIVHNPHDNLALRLEDLRSNGVDMP